MIQVYKAHLHRDQDALGGEVVRLLPGEQAPELFIRVDIVVGDTVSSTPIEVPPIIVPCGCL